MSDRQFYYRLRVGFTGKLPTRSYPRRTWVSGVNRGSLSATSARSPLIDVPFLRDSRTRSLAT